MSPDKKKFFSFSPCLSDVVLIAVFIYWIFFHFMLENFDIWWHLRTGELILSGFFPKQDIFSFTAAGRPWILQEWGSEVIFSLLFSHLGVCGLVMLRAIMLCLTFWIFYTMLVRISIPPVMSFIFTMVTAISIGFAGINIRPQMFTLFFFTLVLRFYIISRYDRRDNLFIPLMIIFPAWINLHGGFIVGFVLLGLCAIGETIDNLLTNRTFFTKAQKSTNFLFAACTIAFLFCLVNPNTYKGLFYPLLYHGQDSIPLYSIAEWHPATWVNSKPFFMILVFLFFIVWISKPKIRFARMIPMGFFMIYTFMFHRIAPFFILCAIAFFAKNIESTVHALSDKLGQNNSPIIQRYWLTISTYISIRSKILYELEKKSRIHLSAPLIIGVISMLILSGQLNSIIPFNVAWDRFPTGNIKALARYMPEGRIFNQYRWGGLLIYDFPLKKIFIDGRMDVYGNKFASEYETVLNLNSGWQNILKKYEVNHILVARDSIIGRFLDVMAPEWKMISTDKLSVLFIKHTDDTPAIGGGNTLQDLHLRSRR